MRFATISAAALAFAMSAFAQTAGFEVISSPGDGENVPAGQTYTIKWAPDSTNPGTVTISLLGGATAGTLQTLSALATGIDGATGSYTWTVDSSLGADATYGIQITLDDNTSIFQYSYPFHIVASAATTTAAATTAATSGYPVESYPASQIETYPASEIETTTVAVPTTYAVATSTVAPVSTYVASVVSYPASAFSTVTVSSAPVPTYSASSVAPAGNYSATGYATASAGSSTSSAKPSSSSTVVSTNGAPRAAAGSIALIGAIVGALFAL